MTSGLEPSFVKSTKKQRTWVEGPKGWGECGARQALLYLANSRIGREIKRFIKPANPFLIRVIMKALSRALARTEGPWKSFWQHLRRVWG
jgi:hypothetical protein